MPKEFNQLKIAEKLITEQSSSKGVDSSIMDLKRTSKVVLATGREHPSWFEDASILDYFRYWMGIERRDKVSKYNFPNEKDIKDHIFLHAENIAIRDYIKKYSHQDGFKDAARTEIMLRLQFDKFFIKDKEQDAVKCSLEYYLQEDSSVIVIESFDLSKGITYFPHAPENMEIGRKNLLSSGGIVSFVLSSKITENDGNVKHEIADFSIEAHDLDVCSQIFAGKNMKFLLRYVSCEDSRKILDSLINTKKIEISRGDEWEVLGESENLSAITMQRCWKKYQSKKNLAAFNIQCCWKKYQNNQKRLKELAPNSEEDMDIVDEILEDAKDLVSGIFQKFKRLQF